MKRLGVLALAVTVALSALTGPSVAGGFSFDLPVLTWPEDGAVLGTKGAKP